VRSLRFLASAEQDLFDIFDYIADSSKNPGIARRFTATLEDQCRKLAQWPAPQGRPRNNLRPDLRSIPFGNYVIFFRYVDEAVEIVNIVEGHRDIDALFDPDDAK
jgi:toxin ParE1/3/4